MLQSVPQAVAEVTGAAAGTPDGGHHSDVLRALWKAVGRRRGCCEAVFGWHPVGPRGCFLPGRETPRPGIASVFEARGECRA